MDKLTLQTIPEVPNAVYVPQFLIQTGINNGKLTKSCQITFAAVQVVAETEKGEQWIPTQQVKSIYISDLDNLDPDLEKFGVYINQFWTDIMYILENINDARKVL